MRKRVCFVSLTNLYLTPYINSYIENLSCEYDIISWNRHNVEEDFKCTNHYQLNFRLDEEASKILKLKGYLKFAFFVRKILKREEYSGVIILHTVAGIMLSDLLKVKYKRKYIMDIRDFSVENNRILFKIEKGLIKNAKFNIISSEGYRKFLPNDKYIITHNINRFESKKVNKLWREKTRKDKITITNIGLIRFHSQNIKFINIFKNDERFLLKFIGKNSESLIEYCDENDIKNVEIVGQFPQEKTFDYLINTDIIFNLYGNNTPLLEYALSNKLYYSAQLGIPILVSPRTYMSEISQKYGLGYEIDLDNPDEEIADDLFEFFNKIKWTDYRDNSEKFLGIIEDDMHNFEKAVRGF